MYGIARFARALFGSPAAGALYGYQASRSICIFQFVSLWRGVTVRSYTAVVERDTETGLLVGHIPGFRGAHSQAATMEELEANLAEVVAMLLEDGEPHLEAEFVGTQTVRVA
jgi:predicted RNase H-like HicB family nuclease